MKITIIFYATFTGKKLGEQDCDSVAHAFSELSRVNSDAHAFPVGTTHGLYNWQRIHEHDIETFAKKMAAIARARNVGN